MSALFDEVTAALGAAADLARRRGCRPTWGCSCRSWACRSGLHLCVASGFAATALDHPALKSAAREFGTTRNTASSVMRRGVTEGASLSTPARGPDVGTPAPLDQQRRLGGTLVDEIATKLVRPMRTEVDIHGWAVDDDMWIRRAAILCQVGAKQGTGSHFAARCHQNPTRPTVASGSPKPSAGRCATMPTSTRLGAAVRQRHELAPLSVREATKHL